MMNCSEQQHHGLQNAYGQNWILMVTQITKSKTVRSKKYMFIKSTKKRINSIYQYKKNKKKWDLIVQLPHSKSRKQFITS